MAYLHGRLSQIKHIRSTARDVWFGNVSILAVGDFHQLPPVRAKSLMIPDCSHGIDIWHDIFTITFLDEVMRQKDDKAFAELLNRLRLKSKNETLSNEDDAILRSRVNLPNEPGDALHVYATNKKASEYNANMLANITDDPHKCEAIDYEKDPRSGKCTKTKAHGHSDDMSDCLVIAPNARVMLTRNIDVPDGLANGAFGTVVAIEPADRECDTKVIFVKFDSEKIGTKKKTIIPGSNDKAVAIERHEETMASYKSTIRRQFPLKLAWGCTIHKVQGMTTNQCVFDMDGIFAAGQSYVALSRVTSLEGLFIQNYDPQKIYRNDAIEQHISTMQKESGIKNQTHVESWLTISHHNIQGLQSKIEDTQNCLDALSDVMLFSSSS